VSCLLSVGNKNIVHKIQTSEGRDWSTEWNLEMQFEQDAKIS
jgi:hypothetical protein